MRTVWRHYYETINGVVFVVDSSDIDRIPEVRDELHKIISEALGVPIKATIAVGKNWGELTKWE